MELNVSASGVDLADTENNLKDAIEAYIEDIKEYLETVVEPITVNELIEFLQDTEPEWHGKLGRTLYFRPFEVHEVPVYV